MSANTFNVFPAEFSVHALHHPRQLLLLLLPGLQLCRDRAGVVIGEIRVCLSAAPQVHSTAPLRLPAHRLRQSVSTHAHAATTRSLIAPLWRT